MCKKTVVLISVVLVLALAGSASALLVDGYREWTGTLQLADLFGLEITKTGHAKFTSRVNQDGCDVTIAAGGILETLGPYKLPDEYPPTPTTYSTAHVNGTWNAADIQFMGAERAAYIYIGRRGVINLQTGYSRFADGSNSNPLTWLSDNSLLVDPSLDPSVWVIEITDMGGGAARITAESLYPVVSFDWASSGDLESVSPAELVVTLDGAAPGQSYTVDYAVTGGTAEGGGVDYALAPGTLTFNPGETSKTISIDIIDDGLDEGAETIVVELSNATGPDVVLGAVQHTYTIQDPRPTVAFDADRSSNNEDAGRIETTVSLSFATPLTVTVDYSVTGGTATGGGVDYILDPGTLTFNPGETTKNISIDLVADSVFEAPKTVEITLSNPSNATLGAMTQFTQTIFDITQAIPVAWWKFDEVSGTTALDSSGNNLNGEVQGNAEWVDGYVGSGGLSISGGAVLINDSPILEPSTITITVWIKMHSPQIRFARILQKGYDNHETYLFQGGGYGMNWIMYDAGGDNKGASLSSAIPANEWAFVAGVYDGSEMRIYLNGELSGSNHVGSFTPYNSPGPLCIGGRPKPSGVDKLMIAELDDVRIYDHGMSDDEIKELYAWVDGDTRVAALPAPKHLAINVSPYTTLSWLSGKGATSHDVYLGADFDDVNNASIGSDEFMGSVDVNSYVPGGVFELGQTYYWRVDEVGDSETAKGTVWQFTIDAGKAGDPDPSDGLANIPVDTDLGWTAGNYAVSHDVFFGTNRIAVVNANTSSPEYKGNQVETTYDPGSLARNTTYYWRIDEIGGADMFAKGDVWSFSTVGGFHLQVDFGLPVCFSRWDDVRPVEGTVKEGWWGRVFWGDADMYMHDKAWEDGSRGMDPPDTPGVSGSGVHFALDTARPGNGGYHVHGMCRANLGGDGCAGGVPLGEPIANGWFHNIDWGGECRGDINMRITDLPPGEYKMISYHNHWEPCSQGSRNCLDCISTMPPMPIVFARSFPAPGEMECISGDLGSGTGEGVESLVEAYDIKVTSVLTDADVATSTIEFRTNGSDVLVVYDGGDNSYADPARPGREGSKAILNAFELMSAWAPVCACPGDLNADDQVDLDDLQAMVGILLDAGSPFIVDVEDGYCGDLNEDGQVDLDDLQATAGILLNAGSPFIVRCN